MFYRKVPFDERNYTEILSKSKFGVKLKKKSGKDLRPHIYTSIGKTVPIPRQYSYPELKTDGV